MVPASASGGGTAAIWPIIVVRVLEIRWRNRESFFVPRRNALVLPFFTAWLVLLNALLYPAQAAPSDATCDWQIGSTCAMYSERVGAAAAAPGQAATKPTDRTNAIRALRMRISLP